MFLRVINLVMLHTHVHCSLPHALINALVCIHCKFRLLQCGASYVARIVCVEEPDEVSSAVLFLLSDSASMMNGASLMIDGGCTVHTAP